MASYGVKMVVLPLVVTVLMCFTAPIAAVSTYTTNIGSTSWGPMEGSTVSLGQEELAPGSVGPSCVAGGLCVTAGSRGAGGF